MRRISAARRPASAFRRASASSAATRAARCCAAAFRRCRLVAMLVARCWRARTCGKRGGRGAVFGVEVRRNFLIWVRAAGGEGAAR